uniref:Uncharacterized protein n=1 Tax=Physcomitrium patens TaxID=3218 RepID=A9U0U3_PHYPA|nr:hypothetical protein PHYPA_010791 [Physcomitrium patens]
MRFELMAHSLLPFRNHLLCLGCGAPALWNLGVEILSMAMFAACAELIGCAAPWCAHDQERHGIAWRTGGPRFAACRNLQVRWGIFLHQFLRGSGGNRKVKSQITRDYPIGQTRFQ